MKFKAKARRTKKRSIFIQLTAIIMGLVTGTLILCWFLNTWFLAGYYSYNKQKVLLSGFETINKASQEGILTSEDFDVAFEQLCANGNISVLVLGSDGSTIRTSVNDDKVLQKTFYDLLMDIDDEASVLQKHTNYVLEKQKDTRLNSEYLVLWGTLDDGNFILMRTALQSIRESANISNEFLVYIGGISIALSFLISLLVSRRITKPILELSEISRKMSDLDFNVRYRAKSNNEIDELGVHINTLSDTLERTISELKTANNELKIDIEKKNQIDEMRKDFLSNVSHELKTPLALIQGYAEGLKECINDDQESRDFYCEVIIDESDKMNKMVKKLLTLNQLEFGNEVVTLERFDLSELIKGVINAATILLKQNDIRLSFNTDEPVYAWADEFKVEEVITNYLSNAIHHCEGDKRIDIKYTMTEQGVRVSIFNTGKQIPEEDLDNIWVKFYKVDKARTREYGGSGIGLSIVKAIMDSFHHECGAKNHADGVEFWFELDVEKK